MFKEKLIAMLENSFSKKEFIELRSKMFSDPKVMPSNEELSLFDELLGLAIDAGLVKD